MKSDWVYMWRHPRPRNVEGRCIGRTDVEVDPRKTKRLAHRIRAFARRHRLPRIVVTSPLRRCADAGLLLATWGWQHKVDPRLLEVDFGTWEGRPWDEIPRGHIDGWCADFVHFRPGGGESLSQLLLRVQAWNSGEARVAIGHAGWLCAVEWLAGAKGTNQRGLDPALWPRPPAYGAMRRLPLE
ncbi:MAG TPA: histidine phosphatase family protein [Burkholderiaceae bacterium]|nr:histidine phosphatase family protein [Burkholderiaceae bacterium]